RAAVGVPLTRRILAPPQAPGPARQAGRTLRGSRRPTAGPSVPANSAPGASRTGEGWRMGKEKWRAEQWEWWETGPRERMSPPDTRAARTGPVRERAARTDSASGRGVRTDPVRARAGRRGRSDRPSRHRADRPPPHRCRRPAAPPWPAAPAAPPPDRPPGVLPAARGSPYGPPGPRPAAAPWPSRPAGPAAPSA